MAIVARTARHEGPLGRAEVYVERGCGFGVEWFGTCRDTLIFSKRERTPLTVGTSVVAYPEDLTDHWIFV
jgi:hypothetical protein